MKTSNYRIHRLLIILVVILLVGGFQLVRDVKSAPVIRPEGALVVFRAPLTSSEAGSFLREYNLSPSAVYMVEEGLVGTYRTYEPKDIDEFLETARQESIRGMQKALQSNAIHLREFTKQHSLAEVVIRSSLQKELASLLDARFDLQKAVSALQGNGTPFIYALEVKGEGWTRLDNDQRIANLQAFSFGDKPPVPSTSFQMNEIMPVLRQMSPGEMYDLAKEIAP